MPVNTGDSYGEMVVCRACGEPKGRVPWQSVEAVQLCNCASKMERNSQLRWGGDFNAAASARSGSDAAQRS